MVDGPNLQGPRRQNSPEPYADLVGRLVKLRQDINDLTGSILRSAGIRVTPEGMTIESALDVLGSLDVSGQLATTGATTIGGTLNVTGDAVFSGNLAVPNGSITNDALQNPVRFYADFSDVGSPINLANTEVELTRLTFSVPTGFTQVFVVGYGSIGVVNPTAAIASVAGRIYIDTPAGTVSGPRRFQSGPAGSDIATFPYKQTTAAGVPSGSTVTVRLNGINTGSSWGSTVGGASLNVQAYFTR